MDYIVDLLARIHYGLVIGALGAWIEAAIFFLISRKYASSVYKIRTWYALEVLAGSIFVALGISYLVIW